MKLLLTIQKCFSFRLKTTGRRRERENTPNFTQKGNCTQISLFQSALLFKLSRFCKLWCIGIFRRMECIKIWGANKWEHWSWRTKPKVGKISCRSNSATQEKKGLIKCHQNRHQNTEKISFKSIQSAIKRHLQDGRGTLMLFEGGNLKAGPWATSLTWENSSNE